MKMLLFMPLVFLQLAAMAQKKLVSEAKGVYPLNNNDSLFCYYFSVKSNISNPQLPYYKEKPTLEDILQVATTMPCDSFTVRRDGRTVLTINLKRDSVWRFNVREPSSHLDSTFNSELMGAMTEHRSIELINNGYDKKAGQVFGKFNFNNQQIPYVTTKNMENAVLKVVDYFLYVRKK